MERRHLTQSLAALFFALLVVHGVERNPGPGAGEGTEKNGGGGADGGKDRAGPKTRQATLNLSVSSSAPKEPSLADIMAKLVSMDGMKDDVQSIRTNVSSMKEDLQSLKTCFTDLKNEVDDLKKQVSDLKKENRDLSDENYYLNERLMSVENNTEMIDNQMRRNNLIFYGLDKDEVKSKGCEKVVKDVLKKKMGMNGVEFEQAHKLGNGENAPIMAKCKRNEDKINILKSKQKLKGTGIFIDEDFSQRIRDTRRILVGKMKTLKKEGKTVRLVFDHLIVDDKKMYLDQSGENLIDQWQ